jgi:hypothetical protein
MSSCLAHTIRLQLAAQHSARIGDRTLCVGGADRAQPALPDAPEGLTRAGQRCTQSLISVEPCDDLLGRDWMERNERSVRSQSIFHG